VETLPGGTVINAPIRASPWSGAMPVGGVTPLEDDAFTAAPAVPNRYGPTAAAPSPRIGGLTDAIELRELRYFAAAARRGNLARAAQDLNVTASAVSQRLRKLEDELGTALLVRHGRGVTTTQAGFRLLERIDAVIRLLNAPLGPEDPRAAPDGTLAIAVPAELAAVLAMPILAAVSEQFPGVTPILKESVDGGVDSRLLADQVDIAIVPDPSELEELHIEPVLTERIGVVVAPQSALAAGVRPIRLRELDCLPLILPGKRHWLRRLLARVAYRRGARCDPTFEVDGLAVIKEIVRRGQGCAVLPASAVHEEAARGALVFRPIEQPVLAATYAVACAQQAPALTRCVARAMHGAIHALGVSNAWPGVRCVRPPGAAPASPPAAGQPEQAWGATCLRADEENTAMAAAD